MHNLQVDGHPVRLAGAFDLSFLAAYGRVFRVYDDQDSGNLCFGVQADDGARRFVKVAGAPTVRGSVTPAEAIRRMLETLPVYAALAHPVLMGIAGHHAVPGGYVAVSDWFDGVCMGKMYGQTARFLALPLAQKLSIYEAILAFHLHVETQGYIAVDFYDGCVLYSFDTQETRLCDIEMYRPGPFDNDMGRMWGSSRYMAPEEFTLGSRLDARTNVYRMGATAFELMGGGQARDRAQWEANNAAYAVALRAVSPQPADRYASVSAFRAAWTEAITAK